MIEYPLGARRQDVMSWRLFKGALDKAEMSLDCDEIIPGRLWVGAYVRPQDVQELREMGVTTVVNLQSTDDYAYWGISETEVNRAFAASGIELRRAPVQDFNKEAMEERLPHCVAEVERALASEDACVYLHCTAGVNRSPTVAAALLMCEQGMTAREAFDFVNARRRCSPYLEVLERFEPPPGRRAEPMHPGS